MTTPIFHDDTYASLIRDNVYTSLINYNWFSKNNLVMTILYKYDIYLNLEKALKYSSKYLILSKHLINKVSNKY